MQHKIQLRKKYFNLRKKKYYEIDKEFFIPLFKLIRLKLKKRLGLIEEKITEEALEKKTEEIHRWISKHAKNRVVLKNKSISLFDSNKNTAQMSKKTKKMADELAKQMEN